MQSLAPDDICLVSFLPTATTPGGRLVQLVTDGNLYFEKNGSWSQVVLNSSTISIQIAVTQGYMT